MKIHYFDKSSLSWWKFITLEKNLSLCLLNIKQSKVDILDYFLFNFLGLIVDKLLASVSLSHGFKYVSLHQ